MARIPAHLLPHSRRPVGLVPESLLPDQYAQRGWRAAEGERRLLLAVLERAYLDLCGRAESKHQRHLVQGARGWVERDDESHLFTFHNCCLALGLEPAVVRRAMLSKTTLVFQAAPLGSAPRIGNRRNYETWGRICTG